MKLTTNKYELQLHGGYSDEDGEVNEFILKIDGYTLYVDYYVADNFVACEGIERDEHTEEELLEGFELFDYIQYEIKTAIKFMLEII